MAQLNSAITDAWRFDWRRIVERREMMRRLTLAILAEEARFAIVDALGDGHRSAIKGDSGAACVIAGPNPLASL
jgi:hypothetical protein